MALNSQYFEEVVQRLTQLLFEAPVVHVGEWQAIQGDIPQGETIEVEDVSFSIPIWISVEGWQHEVKPNLPWSEDHFLERVSGIPYNPPPSSAWWPHAQKNNSEFKSDEKFSHTYPERFWPKYAGGEFSAPIRGREGIRYRLGDLADLVKLLKDRPGTRQAYLPVFFPEDTGAVDGQRVPCSLGYHFMIRNGRLKCVYYIRSCDFFRHFRDDAYMAGRLCQWIAKQVGVAPGDLVMHISSLHVFSVERPILESQLAIPHG